MATTREQRRPASAHWPTAALDDALIESKSGFAFAKQRLASAGVPHLRPFNIGIDGEVAEHVIYRLPGSHGKDLASYALEEGDVLFNNTSSLEVVGKAALVRQTYSCGFSNHVTRLRVLDRARLRPAWLLMCLRSLWFGGFFRREANRWIGQASFAPARLTDVHIPLPDLAVQDRLVHQYDVAIREVRGGLALLQSTAELTAEMLPALLAQMGDQLPPERRALHTVLRDVIRNGWSPVCDNSAGGTSVLALGAVLGFRYNPEAVKRTSLPVERDAGYWLEEGDLLISRSNTAELVGHAAIYTGEPSPCIYPDLLMRLRLDPLEADPDFTLLWLQSPEVRSYVRMKATGASPTMQKINQTAVKAIPFPAVSVDRQRELVQALVPILDGLDAAETMLRDAHSISACFDESVLRALIPPV
jgi:hypothetical protein